MRNFNPNKVNKTIKKVNLNLKKVLGMKNQLLIIKNLVEF